MFALSPGVTITEQDFTSNIPAIATSTAAFVGAFPWGPVLAPMTISSENILVERCGKPSDGNAMSFFTAANFLSYANNLLLVRADTANAKNAVALTTGSVNSSISITAPGSGYVTAPTVAFSAPDVDGGTTATGTATISGAGVTAVTLSAGGSGYSAATVSITAASGDSGSGATATATITDGAVSAIVITAAGTGYKVAPTVVINSGSGSGAAVGTVTIGTSTVTGVTVTVAGTGYSAAPTITFSGGGGTAAAATATVTTGTGVKINNIDSYTSSYINGAGLVGEFAAKYPGAMGNSLKVSMADSATYSAWAYKAEFVTAPGTSTYADSVGGSNDELHIIVIDEDGVFSGIRGSILEKFAFVSKASDAKSPEGANNYYKNVVNSRSKYIWWMDHPVLNTSGTAWGSVAIGHTFKSTASAITRSLMGGVDDLSPSDGNIMDGWDIFVDAGQYDINLLPVGKASVEVADYVINSVAEIRKDCIAFISPENVDTGDIIIGSGSDNADALIAYRAEITSSSYAVMDSGYKYQYDKYNDIYRWLPLNGDIAGLCARTDYTNDPWFSPAGYTRGQIKNVVKLAYNPTETDRDNLYKAGINPVVTFPGQGTILFGDKTLLAKPSAFDRINVRRLFIVLEKAIATYAKYQLFELNDDFTRSQFKSVVEPYLRDVQGRRGVTDFKVRCDTTNNTPDIVDSNQFVGDIFIKPSRSINFIQLNFIAARSSVSFSEIG